MKSYLKFQAAFRVEPFLMIGCIDIMDARFNNEHIQYIHTVHYKKENDLISCTHLTNVDFLSYNVIKTVRKNNQASC